MIATSWGRNTMVQADSADPLVMVHGPFGSRAEDELLLARRDPRVKGLAPLNGYPRVRAVIPDLGDRIRSFGAYSDATLDQVLGAAQSRVERQSVTTMDHMVFLNRGNRFEARPLPAEAQFAPAFYAGIADFDGDGNEDAFIAQNFSATASGLPRYDAGRGLLLRGDGTGGLLPMHGQASGIVVYGDQRGAAYSDFDGDARLDIAISQNAQTTRLFRNRVARPGLRVRLRGTTGNPDAVGARLRVVYGDRQGPVREIQLGSGYWSQNSVVQVFGLAGTPSAVWVRWPDGSETRTAVPAATRELTIER
jgi:enediyne biosynthesis protein E4